MATPVKIKGLERDNAAATGTVGPVRGFRVASGHGLQFPSGVKATNTGGTLTNGMVVTAKYGGTWANGHTFTYAAGAADTSFSLAVTYAAGTGVPTYTYTAGTLNTVAQIAAKLNADSRVSQLYTVAPLTTGAGTTPVSVGALASGTNVGTGQPIYVAVSNKGLMIVDVDDAQTQRSLRRALAGGRAISLGAA